MFDFKVLVVVGDVFFVYFGLLFVVGIVVGYVRDNNGVVSLVGVVCFLVFIEGVKILFVVFVDLVFGGVV